MAQSEVAELIPLSDSTLTVASETEDIRGRKAVDRHGEEVGEIDDLLFDPSERRVQFIEIASGGFLGIGESKSLLPVEVIRDLDEDTVYLDKTRTDIAGAPVYQPELAQRRSFWESYYGYYGYPSMWGPGYAYPATPFFAPLVTRDLPSEEDEERRS